jgi:hypothetical protein
MPWHIMETNTKSPKRFFVVTTSSGRKHSAEPLTRVVAKKQLAALEINADKKNHSS